MHLKLTFNWELKPLYDVIARIPGSTYPDEWIIRGNHHDAWVNGTEDPVSAMAAELEEARILGELRRQGWQPKRTIVYAAWDGEEPALLGSTEWVEAHGEELERKGAVYLNSDATGRGFFQMAGSHSLQHFINDVARSVEDPEARVSAWKRLQSSIIARGSAEERTRARSGPDLPIGALGSGSDFTPFLQHNGVASLNLGFGGEDQNGIYHSIYDDFYHYTTFMDSGFSYGRALAQAVGIAVLRLADAAVLPFEFKSAAEAVSGYVSEIKTLLKERREHATELNRQIDDGVLVDIRDPKRPLAIPAREILPPAIDFAPLDKAAARLKESADRYARALAAAGPLLSNTAVVRSVNAKLIQAERQMLDAAGLPNREWYRHLIYAPGFYTGYGVKTIPGLREGIEQKRYQEAEAQLARAARALEREADLISAAAADLEPR